MIMRKIICTFVPMKWSHIISIWVVLTMCIGTSAQNYMRKQVVLPVENYKGDTIPVVHLKDVYIYQRPKFRNRRQERYYWRTVRDVKKTLPIAREVRGIIIETYEYLLTIPRDARRNMRMSAGT